MSSDKTMRAMVLDDYSKGLLVEREVERPQAGPGQVLVRVVASGVNPIDNMIRTGNAAFAEPALPAILGCDLAGVVEAVGEGVTRFRVGDEVFGMVGGVRGLQGTLAEYVAADADTLAIKPKSLSMREAAALPLVFLTAWEGLVDRANIRAGQKVLVQGGAGGVGHIVIQIAKALGADVYATGSTGQQQLLTSLGATPIDYTVSSVEDYVAKYTGGKGFDVVFDAVGGPTLDVSFTASKAYGHVVSTFAFGNHDLAPASLRCVSISGIYVLLPLVSGEGRAHHGGILAQAARLVDEGKVKPIVDSKTYGLSQAQAAHEALKAGKVMGKAVVEV